VTIDGNAVAVLDCQVVEGLRTLIMDPEYTESPTETTILEQQVDEERRRLTQANHTTTHLLHKVLKDVLGDHAEQRGSWVGPTHLRFDFPHNEAVSKEQLAEIEGRVNALIQGHHVVGAKVTSLDAAKEQGVTALFGEKYGEEVRVVSISDESMELCGGTHLKNVSEAMAFVIRSESSVASGIRRIEAITGTTALSELFTSRSQLKASASKFQVLGHELEDRVGQLQNEHQSLRKEASRLRRELVMNRLKEKMASLPSVGAQPYLAEILDDVDAGDLRGAAESIRSQHDDLPILLASRGKNKAAVLIAFPKKWVKEKGVHAGKMLKPLGKHIQGGGGGAPDMAQAGGKNPDGLTEVLKGFKAGLEELLG
jgi:alanyl-tRNA synthetase